jgi:secondary thiamine-phosphate synthase enzyme
MTLMRLTITSTKAKQIIDITDLVTKEVRKHDRDGKACLLFLRHTTAALTTADLDPGTDLDMLDAFEKLIPHLNYRHPHNPAHVPDHILASLIGPSLVLPLEHGELLLGTWQRIVLIELDGPRKREIVLSIS